MKLYVYEHCPFCVKARAIFGLKGVPFELITLLNDDEVTPKRMIGRKMTPILEEEGRFTPESMDIVAYIDAMGDDPRLTGPRSASIEAWLQEVSSSLYPLAMPRWAMAPFPEFSTEAARAFFTRNKEAIVGPFNKLLASTPDLLAQIHAALASLAPSIQAPEAMNGTLSQDDIHLFAALRALSIVRDVRYPPAVEAYRQTMSRLTGVPLHDDVAMA